MQEYVFKYYAFIEIKAIFKKNIYFFNYYITYACFVIIYTISAFTIIKIFDFNQIPMLSNGADPIYQQYPWAHLFVDQK